MYYRFLNQETIDILDEICHKSKNYCEFVHNLGEWVIEKTVSEEIVYLAAVHSWKSRELEVLMRISEKYGQLVLVKPWTYPWTVNFAWDEKRNEILAAIDEAIQSKPPTWIAIDLQLHKRWFEYPPELIAGTLEQVSEIVLNDSDLDCFNPTIHEMRGNIHRHEGDIETALMEFEKGMKSARNLGDDYQLLLLLIYHNIIMYDTDPKVALEIIQEAYELSLSLNLLFFEQAIVYELGMLSDMRGEYNLALRCFLKSVELLEKRDLFDHACAAHVALSYCDVGDYERGLEWAHRTLLHTQGEGDIFSHSIMAYSLILNDSVNDALPHIDKVKKLAFKGGEDRWLLYYYWIQGLYESKAEDPQVSLMTLKNGLDLARRIKILQYMGRLLVEISRVELQIIKTSQGTESADWLLELRDFAEEFDCPGLRIQHALLEADFHIYRKQKNKATEILVGVLDDSDLPALRSLHEQILQKLESI